MKTFIINPANLSVAGLVNSVKGKSVNGFDLGSNVAVKSAFDLEQFSNAQLATLFNGVTGKTVKTFSTAKSASAAKVFAALEAVDVSTLVRLDAETKAKIEKAAEAGAGVRKVRDSKLQRMAACFRESKKDGTPKQFTIAELIERCSKPDDEMTDKIAHQYISILRNPSDRFVIKIAKTLVDVKGTQVAHYARVGDAPAAA